MMNYVNIEQRLIESIYSTYDDTIEDTLRVLWNISRKIDWIVMASDYVKNTKSLFNTIGSTDQDVLSRIVTAAVLRIPEISSTEFNDLLANAVNWNLNSLSNLGTISEQLVINPKDMFADSPDLKILFMFSNVNLTSLRLA